MKHTLLSVMFVSAFVVSGALADEGHSHGEAFAYGQPGDANNSTRTIRVVMKEADGAMLFEPDHIEIRKGEQIRFSMRNHGESDHEFVLGTHEEIVAHAEQMRKNPDMEHDDPNSKRLAAKENGDIVWLFNKPGTFEFACLIPGHMESGMKGTIVVR